MVINNTGYSSVKIFCESKSANIHLHNARKIWSLQQPIVLGASSNVKMLCSVESCSIPLAYYTVNETNNKFSFNGNVGEVSVGNYTANTIVETINRNQTNLKFLYSKDANKFMIQGTYGKNTIDECPNSIYKLLGLAPTTFVRNGDTYHLPPSVCNLVYTSGIYVSLNNISNANIDTGTKAKSTCLLRIPISQPTNTYLQYFNGVGFKNLLSSSVLCELDISLLDDNRNLLQLSDNVDWVIVLRIDFERVINETLETTKINSLRL